MRRSSSRNMVFRPPRKWQYGCMRIGVAKIFGRCAWVTLIGATSSWLAFVATPVAGQETSKDVVAVQVRKQGYPCSIALSAERDLSASKPGEAVWVLRCDNATYRVRLDSDMAAKIERIN